MTKKYICYGCSKPCILEVESAAEEPEACPYILEVESDAEEPEACPYNEPWLAKWELMKEDDNND